ncbi:MAG: NAD(P)/FAD-dependent oxidoreductase [Planctomycetota bacterium]|nr:NAD(P)/FAD-dependent oxidoreductase [Planctomycetota bacterium]
MSEHDDPVLIIGAGLAGLRCAVELQSAGVPYRVLEASDAVGGRMRTDVVDGFRLDRGFQILLTAYPEAQHALDYDALDLRSFYPGALIRRRDRFVRLADPKRKPLAALGSLFGSLGTLADKWRILRLKRNACEGSLAELWSREFTTTDEALKRMGFSEAMRDGFFQPWLSGVFLEKELRTSSRFLDFVVRMFAQGDSAVPAEGMGRIPEQLAARLEDGTIQLNTRVERVVEDGVILENGERRRASKVIVATEGPTAHGLVAGAADPGSRSVTCLYFAAEKDPVGEPTLVLDGNGRGPVTNLAVMSAVSPKYAPDGATLISASVIGDAGDDDSALVKAVLAQLRRWFGADVDGWRHLRTYRIAHALPEYWRRQRHRPLPDNVLVAGDWCENPSIQGALRSGRMAAESAAAGHFAVQGD